MTVLSELSWEIHLSWRDESCGVMPDGVMMRMGFPGSFLGREAFRVEETGSQERFMTDVRVSQLIDPVLVKIVGCVAIILSISCGILVRSV